MVTTWTTTQAFNTQQIMKFLAIQPIWCRVWNWESTTPVYLVIYGCYRQWFMCHFSYVCTCLDHELEQRGRDSLHVHMQLSHVYLTSTLDITHGIKCTRLSPSLAVAYVNCTARAHDDIIYTCLKPFSASIHHSLTVILNSPDSCYFQLWQSQLISK